MLRDGNSHGSPGSHPPGPSFGYPDHTDYRNPELYDIWPKLHLDEKRYLLCRPLLKTDTEAAIRVGRAQSWIKQRRPIFRRAVELREHWDNSELEKLMNEDLLTLAQVDVAGLAQGVVNGSVGNQSDIVKIANAISSLVRRAESRANSGVSSNKRGFVLPEEVRTSRDDEDDAVRDIR